MPSPTMVFGQRQRNATRKKEHISYGGELNKVEFLCVCRTEETSQAVGYHPSKDRVMTLINNINQTSIFASQ